MNPDLLLDIDLNEQRLSIVERGRIVKVYPVSTAKNGPGEVLGSGCTPRGRHRIRAKIGAGQPLNSVFIARRPTGETFTPEFGRQYPERDWILTRILWLSGLEPGKNRFGRVDTAKRFIYIHGSPDQAVTGKPESHGCIRMTSADVAELFERIAVDTVVDIHE
ncbi:MAG: L,D-transpeptidase family protein [Gammaproteobacteria bacterium]